jgi:tetratricopeptide (TPR) repeat protein
MKSETHSGSSSEKSDAWKLLHLPSFHFILIVIIGVAIYSNTFHVPFILDDEGSIQLLTPVHGLANYFAEGWPGYNYLPNRAFGYLTFALNYEFGGLNVTGYHLINLIIHISTALLVYYFIKLIFRTPYMQRAGITNNQISGFAFVVSLIFVCHPIQTQAVTYIVQRLTSMSAMFYLAALVCYMRWRLLKIDSAPIARGQGLGWYCLTMISTLLAMRTKEIAFTLPVIILLCEFSFFGAPTWGLLKKLAPLLMTLVIIPITMFIKLTPFVKSAGGGVGSYLSDTPSNPYDMIQITRWEYLYTQFTVIITYLRLLLLPINQNLDYDYPINHSLFEPRVLFSLLTLLALLTLAVYLYVISSKCIEQSYRGQIFSASTISLVRLASFGIFWFFITLSLESSIVLLKDVIFEHRLYLPSFGFFIALVSFSTIGVIMLEQHCKYLNNIIIIFVSGIVLTLSGATYLRNSIWQNWISLWSDTVSKSPGKPRAHNVLGIGYFYSFKYDEAMKEYEEAVRLKPDYIEAYYNMALNHGARKQHAEAIIIFLKVLSISAFDAEQFAKVYSEIGINYGELGKADQAATAFAESVKHAPESIEYRNNYAYALWMRGDLVEALREFQTVTSLDPANRYALQAIDEIRMQKSGGDDMKNVAGPKRSSDKID